MEFCSDQPVINLQEAITIDKVSDLEKARMNKSKGFQECNWC